MIARCSLIVGVVALSKVALATDYFGGATLPAYWVTKATDFGIDPSKLGFNETEMMWYYDGDATCIGWGEFDDACDFDMLVCSGYNGHSYGYGSLQLAEIKNMIDSGNMEHQLCPNCPAAPAGEVFVCHDGIKYAMPSGDIQQDFGLPGHMSATGKGIWMTCDCEEVHRGYSLVAGTYWYIKAQEAGLDPTKVSYLNGVWYYDGKYSCVAKGPSSGSCDNIALVCSGAGNTYGYGGQQMYELFEAAQLPTGEHAYCPMP